MPPLQSAGFKVGYIFCVHRRLQATLLLLFLMLKLLPSCTVKSEECVQKSSTATRKLISIYFDSLVHWVPCCSFLFFLIFLFLFFFPRSSTTWIIWPSYIVVYPSLYCWLLSICFVDKAVYSAYRRQSLHQRQTKFIYYFFNYISLLFIFMYLFI